MTTQPSWSFSGIKAFENCAKKYYHLRVKRDYKEPQGDAANYGELFHLAAEEYIRDGKDIPNQFLFAKPMLDKIAAIPGDKLCEFEMALNVDLRPCAMDSPEAWWRGIADIVIVQEDRKRALVGDYKTGNPKYADKGQLELMALAIFKYFPNVDEVDARLLFVVKKGVVKARYTRVDEARLWEKWLSKYGRLEAAFINDVWNPNKTGLCRRHCVVTECIHCGE